MSQVADTTNAQEFALHPEGTYLFVIGKVDEGTAKESGNPLIIFDLFPADEQPGRCKFRQFVLNTKESFMLKQYCKACGMPTAGGYDSEEFKGKVFSAEVVHELYKGKMQAKLKSGTLVPSDVKAEVPKNADDPNVPF